MVLLDTETPGTSREIYSEDAGGENSIDLILVDKCPVCYQIIEKKK